MLSSREIERMNIEEANHGKRVLYTPTEELGIISSHNKQYVFVKFDSLLRKRPCWSQVTSQACRSEDLILIPEAPSPYIVKTFIDGKIENTPIGE